MKPKGENRAQKQSHPSVRGKVSEAGQQSLKTGWGDLHLQEYQRVPGAQRSLPWIQGSVYANQRKNLSIADLEGESIVGGLETGIGSLCGIDSQVRDHTGSRTS